ncbi:MAG: sulfite exporter TauE/SafE family protein [Flavobacteriales bacterium]|nr:sulfite exporter TauE/SafE family protein [Flavobacteriales bacterium]
MELLEISGYAGALLIGIVIGLLGGGGAMLAVPVMIYLLRIPTDEATAYSLFVVGTTALIGSLRYWALKQVNFFIAFFFLVPSVIFVYLTRLWLVPAIPQQFFIGDKLLEKKFVLMVFFALLIMVAGISMLSKLPGMRPAKSSDAVKPSLQNSWKLVVISAWGCAVGFLAGLLGAGGGFMIVPVMILLARLPVKMAVGTSLTVIAGQSLVGFLGDLHSNHNLDWSFLASFTSLSLLGMMLGTLVSRKSKPEKIKRAFAWFSLAMGVAIIITELALY